MRMRHTSILSLVTLLRPSHARLFILVAAVLTCGSLTQALANEAHDHASHLARGWKAERDFGHGWGWDPSVGYYEGLFGVARAKGTSAVLTRVIAGIRVHSMECWRTGLQGGLAFGVVGRDIGALSTRARQRAASSDRA